MGVDRDFSVGAWFKYGAADGSLITLRDAGGTVYFDLGVTSTGFTVGVNGITSTVACAYGEHTIQIKLARYCKLDIRGGNSNCSNYNSL
jgi:hypothetical protein